MANIEIKKLPDSEIEISGEITATDFMALWPDTVKTIGAKLTIPGFRPGHAPAKVIIDQVGEEHILFQMAERLLNQRYPLIIAEHKLATIGEPEITITKIAKDNPLGFKIKTALMPEIKLPDYKKIAKAESGKYPPAIETTDDELEKVLTDIRRSQVKTTATNSESTATTNQDLPVLDDEFVKTLGDFSSVEDFKTKVRSNMTAEKKQKNRDKRRLAIIDEIGKEANIAIPEALIEHELDKMASEMKGQIESMGLKFEDYLTHIKKTEADLRNAWRDDAKKRVRFGLIVRALAEQENIKPTDDNIKNEVAQLLSRDPALSENISRSRIENYVANVLTNDLVMKFIDPIEE